MMSSLHCVQAGTITGFVKEIGFIQTKLEGFDCIPIVVPNSLFLTAVSYSLSPSFSSFSSPQQGSAEMAFTRLQFGWVPHCLGQAARKGVWNTKGNLFYQSGSGCCVYPVSSWLQVITNLSRSSGTVLEVTLDLPIEVRPAMALTIPTNIHDCNYITIHGCQLQPVLLGGLTCRTSAPLMASAQDLPIADWPSNVFIESCSLIATSAVMIRPLCCKDGLCEQDLPLAGKLSKVLTEAFLKHPKVEVTKGISMAYLKAVGAASFQMGITVILKPMVRPPFALWISSIS